MASRSPRSEEILRQNGYFVAKVEQIVAGTFIKRDAFGAFDLIAVKPDAPGVLGVQVCASDRKADHVAKLREIEAVWAWLRAGNPIQIHSWRKRRERTKTGAWGAPRWAVAVIPMTLEDLQPEPDWKIVRERLAKEAEARKLASLEKRRATLALKRGEDPAEKPSAQAV